MNNVNSVEDLTKFICSIGLFYDCRNLYGKYNEFMLPVDNGGLSF
jgi:hypothetical protein